MTKAKYPGVYIEESPQAVRTISGCATGVTAFVGLFETGPIATPIEVGSLAEFAQIFGAEHPGSLTPSAVQAFFAHGGEKALVIRMADASSLGDRTKRDGIYALGERADLLALPDVAYLLSPDAAIAVYQQAYKFCAQNRLFLLIDSPPNFQVDDILAWRRKLAGEGIVGPDAALYFPGLVPDDARVPPMPASGFVAGICANTDRQRGVWKAPAGVDAQLQAVGPSCQIDDDQQAVLNPRNINAIRHFEQYGCVIWGARTLADDASEWKYIPVRRLGLFLERSIERGLDWTRSEPNDDRLWQSVKFSVEAFLSIFYRHGAFAGAKPEEAYFVRCDRTTTTQADIEQGYAILKVGFAPLKPAEFIVLTFRLKTA